MMEAKEWDTFYLLWAGVLVFFMQAGFAMLEGGVVHEKNVKNILLKNIVDIALAGIVWFLFGHGIAYGGATGEPRDRFIGHAVNGGEKWFPLHIDDKGTSDAPINSVACTGADCPGADYASWFFQFAFCAVAATIVSGAVAERTKIVAYMIYTFLITGFIYPVVVHMGWSGNGGLSAFNTIPNGNVTLGSFNGGAMDFAGSAIVHMTGGIAALVGAALVGPRLGRFDKDTGKVNNLPQNNSTLVALGTMILWMGWYGFNCGSTLALNGYGTMAARTAVTTTLAPCAACLAVVIFRKAASGVWDLGACCNGVLAGLVSITAGCSTVDPWAAVVIGLLGGGVYVGASNLLLVLKVDDPLDAFAVHGACGAWGTVAVGLFARKAYSYHQLGYCGAFFHGADGCGGELLAAQLALVCTVAVWVGATSLVMFFALKKMGMLRVDQDTEVDGLDYHEHGGAAYDIRVTYRNRKAPGSVVGGGDVEAALDKSS